MRNYWVAVLCYGKYMCEGIKYIYRVLTEIISENIAIRAKS